MLEYIILDTDKIIDGETGKQLSHSDQMIDVMNTERDSLHLRYSRIQQEISALEDEMTYIAKELNEYDKPSVGDIRRNGDKSQ